MEQPDAFLHRVLPFLFTYVCLLSRKWGGGRCETRTKSRGKEKEIGIARIYLNFIAGRVSHGTEVGVI